MHSLRPASRLLRHIRAPLTTASRPSLTAKVTSKVTSATTPQRPFSQTSPQKIIPDPINIPQWLKENAHLLTPPINNHILYRSPTLTIMLVGGPNARTDYHINSTPEWFYQIRGSMLLKIVEEAPSSPSTNPSSTKTKPVFRDITIPESSTFFLPPNTPHNPVRFADTVGIVVELGRPEGEVDRLRWYCKCGAVVNEEAFVCTDLGTQIKDAVVRFEKDLGKRTCKSCGEVCEVRPKTG